MATHLYLGPAGHGKTTYVLERIRQARTADPLAPITVILPNQTQVSAFRHRLSLSGGGLGVSLGTFYTLYPEVLAWAGQPAPRLPEPVQYRLIRSIVVRLTDAGHLLHYAPLRDKPGFVVALRTLLEELKRAGIRRDDFRQAIHKLPRPEPRLTELIQIYTAYQDWLLDHGWADTEGQGWLAALVLEDQPDLGRHLRLLVVDGFDEFNRTQLDVLKRLADRAAETVVTMTGSSGSSPRPVLRRFTRALHVVSQTLNLTPEPLSQPGQTAFTPLLAHLEANLFETHSQPKTSPDYKKVKTQLPGSEITSLTMLEAQNWAEEVRAALRWLKARLVRDQMLPVEVALLARDLTPYRPFIEEIAAEFGLTIHVREGLSLAANPAITALLSLLALPTAAENGNGNWARRLVIEAWRSPYFEDLTPGMTPRDADHLDAVARNGLVIQGLDQWQEALTHLVKQAAHHDEATAPSAAVDEDFVRPEQLSSVEADALRHRFAAFVARLTPPGQASLLEYASFVENLIGDDPELRPASPDDKSPEAGRNDLGLVNRARTVPATASRDIAALRTFKDVLRGLVLAESALGPSDGILHNSDLIRGQVETITYDRFYDELRNAVQGTPYYPPPPEPARSAVPVLSVLNARGLSFRAVALVGLAEGEFPRVEREDVLLREEDRRALQKAGLANLESRLHGDEITFFYQAITRTREKLLLCRPYLADDGQTWEPSPYWQEVRRLIDAPVQHIRPEDPTPLSEVASLPEFMRTATQLKLADRDVFNNLSAIDGTHLLHTAAVLNARLTSEPQGPFEGDLTDLAQRFAVAYGPEHVWSSSRLEAYGLCPHHFWLGQDLALETRQPPDQGFDVFILGSMYHEILEKIYSQAGTKADGEQLLALVPEIAAAVFEAAPEQYGFRPTPLWAIQRRELEQIIARTVVALTEATVASTPLVQEQVFGMRDELPLVVQGQDDEFRVRGFIDRVDQDEAGRLHIIDYKSGSTPISGRDLAEGRRLQIALYALAARDALNLGDIADGFYWHIGSAKASSLKLANFEGGVAGALDIALSYAFRHVAGVRSGRFAPTPPAGGCPSHCPGAKFCWRYQAKGW